MQIAEVIRLGSRYSVAPTVFSFSGALDSAACRCIENDLLGVDGWKKAAAHRYTDENMGYGIYDSAVRDVEIRRITDRAYFDVATLFRDLHSEVQKAYDINFGQLSEMTASFYQKGCHIRAHSDADTIDAARLLTFVLMVSNRAVGGELYFPQFKYTHSFNDGELLMFPAEATHQVSPITSGTRLSIIWFAETEF